MQQTIVPDKQTVEACLRQRSYEIDFYQREYVWSKDTVETLLKDIFYTFEISYEDLKLRGPGDILGTRQSGLPAFILGNLIEDTRFIDAARKDAHIIAENQDIKEYKEYYDRISQVAIKNFIS